MALSRGTGLGGSGLSDGLPNLGGSGGEDRFDPTASFAPGANSAWDFINNYARFKDVYYGPLANTPGWSFTRASTGYAQTAAGVLVPFASGELRRTDKGVLTEGAGTNLCLQSQTFDNASWTKNQTTVSADAAAAPDGTTTADKVTPAASSFVHNLAQTVTGTAASHTASIYLKPAGYSKFGFRENTTLGSYATFNLSGSGSVIATGTASATITALADGWYRVTITYTAAATPQLFGWYVLDDAYASGSPHAYAYTADGTSGIYYWGAQIEATAYASSYVPTTTGSATRAAGSLTVTGVTGLDYPLSLYAEFERASDSGAGEVVFVVSNGTSGDRIQLEVNSSDLARAQITAGSAGQFDETVATAIATGTVNKLAARGATNDARFAKNGTLSNADATVTLPATPNKISFGLNPTGSSPFYGYLRRAALWTRALTNAELQSLTT